MKKKLLIFVLIFNVISTYSFSQLGFNWAFNPVTTSMIGDVVSKKSMTVDADGNSYIIISFSETADFDMGEGILNLYSDGSNYLAKYDALKNLVYVKSISGANANSISTDSDGNLYITGSFSGTVDFDLGDGVENLTAFSMFGSDLFIAKYDPDANYIYAKQIGNTDPFSFGWSSARNIKVGINGNIIIIGSLDGSLDFDPGIGIAELQSIGNSDIFVASYDTNGNYEYAFNIGGQNGYIYTYTFDIDTNENIYIAGSISGEIDMDPGAGISNLISTGKGAFFAKYDASGNYVFAECTEYIIFNGNAETRSIAVNSEQEIYITGNFSESVDFDPGVGETILSAGSGSDIFIAKYDANGNYVFANNISGGGWDDGYSMLFDQDNNLLVTGTFYETADFDLSGGIANLTAGLDGYPHAFIAKYDQTLAYIAAISIDISTFSSVSFFTDSDNNIYISDALYGSSDFNPDSGTAILTAPYNLSNPYIAKYNSSFDYQWAGLIGGYDRPVETVSSVKTDPWGNVIMTGIFSGSVDFDPGEGIVELTSQGNSDIFIAKYTGSGDLLFAENIGGTDEDKVASMVIDDLGNIYITGDFKGTADFDPGPGVSSHTAVGYNDIYFAKYDPFGNYVFANRLEGEQGETPYSIILDNTGKIILTGSFKTTIDFDPGPGVAALTTPNPSSQGSCYFAKYNNNGTYISAKQIIGNGSVYPYSIAIDYLNNIHLAGYYYQKADFDPGSGTAELIPTNVNSAGIFLAKYDSEGNYLFAKDISGQNYEFPKANIAVDNTGYIYMTGQYNYTVDFDPSEQVAELSPVGSYDIYFAKYDPEGNYIFAKSIGGTNTDIVKSILFNNNSIYLSGYFNGTADFDPGIGQVDLVSNGYSDGFIAKYNTEGNCLYALNYGGQWGEMGESFCISSDDQIFLSGRFEKTSNFDFGEEVSELTASYNFDVYLVSYTEGPEINVKGNDMTILSGSTTTSADDFTDFGSFNIGETVTKVFTIENIGVGNLNLTNTPRVDISGSGFSLSADAPVVVTEGSSVLFEVSFSPSQCGDVYNGTVSIANDDSNENPYTFLVSGTATDNTAPVADISSLEDVTGECNVTISTTPTATDNCEGTVNGITSDPLTYIEQGTYTITWTYDDGNGNSLTQEQTVIVDDVTAPVADISSLEDITEECSVNISTTPTATDNCEGSINGTTSDPLTYTEQGTYTITWTYDDDNGNSLTQEQTVIVDDATIPTIACQGNQETNADDTHTYTVQGTEFDPIENSDNCEVSSIENSFNGSSTLEGAQIPEGTTQITWTIIDVGENTNTCSFEVLVNGYVGIEELSEEMIVVYPNPTTGIVMILGITNSTEFIINITDITGKTTSDYKLHTLQGEISVDISNFKNGIYIISIQTEDCVFKRKIIKE